jgi:transcriptional regulator with XRE-family HTH domain/Zn-dependent peptidase ImmA (M78 family)
MNDKITKTTWENSNYQKIKEAKVNKATLTIGFENGDVVEVSKDVLLPLGFSNPDWEKMTFNNFEIIIPADPDILEIQWDKIRVLTDASFAKYLAKVGEEQATLVGIKIKKMRERLGLKGNDLAEKAGVAPQTLSRIERGRTDVGFSTLKKILGAMGHSLKDLANEEYEHERTEKSIQSLLKRMNKIGLDKNFLTKKIIPKKVQNALLEHEEKQPELLLDKAASYIGLVYGWTIEDIWKKDDLQINSGPASIAFFKTPSNINLNQIKAYTHYAFYLGKVVLKAQIMSNEIDPPLDVLALREQYFKMYKHLDFDSLLNYVWELGICVLPLNDPGVFHGASWNIQGKHVIVLKQNTTSHARWIFDLLHELYHIFVHLQEPNSSVIETEELSPFSNPDTTEELEANSFANKVIFGTRAEELAEECIKLANWNLANLKGTVIDISKKEKVRSDFLANYLAFKLAYQGHNWWATASKMQIDTPDPFDLAVEHLKRRISLEKLNPVDSELLTCAIEK